MKKPTILVTDPIGGESAAIRSLLEAHGMHAIIATCEGWRNQISSANAMIVNSTVISSAEILQATKTKVIVRLGVGVDNIDVATATDSGIWVANVPDYCADEVAEHALAMILSLTRRLRSSHMELARGTWNQLGHRGIRLVHETTLGIVGFGRLGRSLARKSAAMGFRVVGHDPCLESGDQGIAGISFLSFEELLSVADIVSLHLPLTEGTRHLIDARRLRLMKRTAFLINVSRGGLVDEAALVKAIMSEELGGAGLDTFESEPLPRHSPLHGHPNVILTPHMAFLSEASLMSLQRQAVEEVTRVLAGQPPKNPVNEVNSDA
jgi:D-3-phosphoglycerate dehydrogenase